MQENEVLAEVKLEKKEVLQIPASDFGSISASFRMPF